VHFFSAAQCVGYLAFVLGVTAFSQKSDRKLKALNAAECLVYAVHFVLLGNLPAASSSSISGIRSFLALRFRSRILVVAIIVANLILGFIFVKHMAGWLPVAASCLATIAFLLMRGVRMRLVLLVTTFLWLANNILCGSIGGTLLESVIATMNVITMAKLLRARSQGQKTGNPPTRKLG
jgi:hypothetical protein